MKTKNQDHGFRDQVITVIGFAIFVIITLTGIAAYKAHAEMPNYSGTSVHMSNGSCADITGKMPEKYGTNVNAYLNAEPEAAAQTLTKVNVVCKTVIKHDTEPISSK